MSLQSLNYPQLVQMQQDLSSHAPGDPTFNAAVSVLLKALINDLVVAAKERHEQDQKAAEEASQQAKQAEQAPQAQQSEPQPVMAEAEEETHSRRRR